MALIPSSSVSGVGSVGAIAPRVYTEADFAALSGEPLILGWSAPTLWGAIVVGWVLASAVIWIQADERFSSPVRAKRWRPTAISLGVGFAVLMVCYLLKLRPLGGAVLGLASCAATLLALWLRARWRTLLKSKSSRRVAVAVAAWIAAVQLWGVIWEWDIYFSTEQFVTLTLGAPALGLLALAGWRWANRGAA